MSSSDEDMADTRRGRPDANRRAAPGTAAETAAKRLRTLEAILKHLGGGRKTQFSFDEDEQAKRAQVESDVNLIVTEFMPELRRRFRIAHAASLKSTRMAQHGLDMGKLFPTLQVRAPKPSGVSEERAKKLLADWDKKAKELSEICKKDTITAVTEETADKLAAYQKACTDLEEAVLRTCQKLRPAPASADEEQAAQLDPQVQAAIDRECTQRESKAKRWVKSELAAMEKAVREQLSTAAQTARSQAAHAQAEEIMATGNADAGAGSTAAASAGAGAGSTATASAGAAPASNTGASSEGKRIEALERELGQLKQALLKQRPPRDSPQRKSPGQQPQHQGQQQGKPAAGKTTYAAALGSKQQPSRQQQQAVRFATPQRQQQPPYPPPKQPPHKSPTPQQKQQERDWHTVSRGRGRGRGGGGRSGGGRGQGRHPSSSPNRFNQQGNR